MPSSSSVLPHKSTRIKQDDKFFSRCLTREVSMSNFFIEDYQGGASVAVPFNWESQPGTPKVKYLEAPLPPLTPPPSYYYTSPKRPKKHSKPNLLASIFSKRGSRKTSAPSSPVFLSSTSSSSGSPSPWTTSYSVPSSPMRSSNFRGKYGLSSPRLLFDPRADEEQLDHYESPVSTLCFCCGANARSRGRCASMIKVLFRDVQ